MFGLIFRLGRRLTSWAVGCVPLQLLAQGQGLPQLDSQGNHKRAVLIPDELQQTTREMTCSRPAWLRNPKRRCWCPNSPGRSCCLVTSHLTPVPQALRCPWLAMRRCISLGPRPRSPEDLQDPRPGRWLNLSWAQAAGGACGAVARSIWIPPSSSTVVMGSGPMIQGTNETSSPGLLIYLITPITPAVLDFRSMVNIHIYIYR